MTYKSLFFSLLVILSACSSENTEQQQMQEIETTIQELIAEEKANYDRAYEKRIMKIAVPLADSILAEMYAQPIRDDYVKPDRPVRPEKPDVDIPPFPLDSID